MGIRLSFELSDRDLAYFREALRHSRDAVRDASESEIIEAIRDVLDEIRNNEPLPDFVANRLPELEMLIRMLTDDEWQLPTDMRESLLATFVYFGDPEDILPDDVPVIGYLDDVIVIELISRELEHVREAYAEFCDYRDDFDAEHDGVDPALRRDRLDRRRRELHQRMLKRTSRDNKEAIF